MNNFGSSLMAVTRKAIRGFQFVEDSIIVVGVAFIFVAVLMQAIFRYLIRSMPLGLEEMAIIVASWVYFVGLGVATRCDNHMVITIIDQVNLPEMLRKVIQSLGDLLVVCVSGTFAYYSIVYGYNDYKSGIIIVPFNISDLFKVGPMAIGMIMSTIYASVRLIQQLMVNFK